MFSVMAFKQAFGPFTGTGISKEFVKGMFFQEPG